MRAALLCAALWLAALPAAQARSLYWPSLTVHVEVDSDGALHVTERHEMMFDGDWNGGERTFQLRSWHDLELGSLAELSPDGARTEIVKGDLDDVNEYKLANGRVLRWRSRLPTDPPFDHALKTYEIAYTLEGALRAEGDGYVLNHDLAFPDRSAEIERFDATIELAPEWESTEVPRSIHREHLQSGQSVFVVARLRYLGSGKPSAVASAYVMGSTTSLPWLRYTAVAIVVAFALLSALHWLRSERARGRFDAAVPLDQIDEQWLADNVFNLRPELVGAAWDRETSAAEVAALIARLAQEGKLSSAVARKGAWIFQRDVLQLELLRERSEFDSYERRLIDRLFFDERREVDTDAIRAHYKSSGFNPVSAIEAPLKKRLNSVFGARLSLPRWRLWLTAGLLLAGAASMALSFVWSPDTAQSAVVSLVALVILFVLGAIFAYRYNSNVLDLSPRIARALIAPILVCAGLAYVLFEGPLPLVPLQLIGLPLLALGVLNSVFNRMHSREIPKGMQLRRALGSARKYFERELASGEPRLKDEWFPYLLAFGLGPDVDRWFKRFGGATRGASSGGIGTTFSTSGHAGGSSSTWTGGGGTFGGGGASGSWTAAVAGVAAGVSAPSSSSGSGGGGGGGGGSSGGGGGGGW